MSPNIQTNDTDEKEPLEKEKRSWIKPLRTYKSDIAEAIKRRGTSLTRIVLAEKAKEEEEEEKRTRVSQKNVILLIAGLIFVIAGIGIVSFVFIAGSTQEEKAALLPLRDIIFTEQQKKIELLRFSKKEIETVMTRVIQETNLPLNQTARIYFVKKEELPPFGTEEARESQEEIVGIQELFLILRGNIPPALLRALDEEFLLGIHSFTQNNPFLIVKTISYENAFSGMLAWERFMADDLKAFFILDVKDKDISSGRFEDIVIKNKDARVLKDINNTIVLLYAFINRETIVIATNEITFDEIIKRLKIPRR